MNSPPHDSLSPEERAELIASVKNFRVAMTAIQKGEKLFARKVIKRGKKRPLVLEAWGQKETVPGLWDHVYRVLFRTPHGPEKPEEVQGD